jgi:hypothetical protein
MKELFGATEPVEPEVCPVTGTFVEPFELVLLLLLGVEVVDAAAGDVPLV